MVDRFWKNDKYMILSLSLAIKSCKWIRENVVELPLRALNWFGSTSSVIDSYIDILLQGGIEERLWQHRMAIEWHRMRVQYSSHIDCILARISRIIYNIVHVFIVYHYQHLHLINNIWVDHTTLLGFLSKFMNFACLCFHHVYWSRLI